MRFGRQRGDPPPSSPVAALLASDGRAAFSDEAVVAAAAAVGAGGVVGVVTIARIHGFTLGMQHPGLLPTREELADRQRWVSDAVRRLADGQICITRRHASSIVAAARRRHAPLVVVDQGPVSRARRWVEGELGPAVRRRLRRSAVDVRVVDAGVRMP